MKKSIEKLNIQLVNIQNVIRDLEKNPNYIFVQNIDWMKGVAEGIRQSIKVMKDETDNYY